MREALASVAFSWVVASVISVLPYWIHGCAPTYADAFFEGMSGYTTTGAARMINAFLAAVTVDKPAIPVRRERRSQARMSNWDQVAANHMRAMKLCDRRFAEDPLFPRHAAIQEHRKVPCQIMRGRMNRGGRRNIIVTSVRNDAGLALNQGVGRGDVADRRGVPRRKRWEAPALSPELRRLIASL